MEFTTVPRVLLACLKMTEHAPLFNNAQEIFTCKEFSLKIKKFNFTKNNSVESKRMMNAVCSEFHLCKKILKLLIMNVLNVKTLVMMYCMSFNLIKEIKF